MSKRNDRIRDDLNPKLFDHKITQSKSNPDQSNCMCETYTNKNILQQINSNN